MSTEFLISLQLHGERNAFLSNMALLGDTNKNYVDQFSNPQQVGNTLEPRGPREDNFQHEG